MPIRFLRGNAQRWLTVDPILKSGQPGYDFTNKVLKIGDGDSRWSELDPIGADLSALDDIYDTVEALTGRTDELLQSIEELDTPEEVDTKIENAVSSVSGTPDSGWRNVASLSISKWDYSQSNNYVRVRRSGSVVHMSVLATATAQISPGEVFITLPSGFRSSFVVAPLTVFVAGPLDSPAGTGYLSSAPNRDGQIFNRSWVASATTLSVELSWMTDDEWPQVLPGTPA